MREPGTNLVNTDLIKKKMITDIYCFGSSYTAGGGFEFDSNWFDSTDSEFTENIKNWKEYLDSQTETPKTHWHYSWPGQLQKLVGKNIKIHNLAKQGNGNQRTLRLVYDLINSNEFRNDTSLFLFEFTWLARDELFCNYLNSHVVHNYSIENDKFGVGYLANCHHYDDNKTWKYLNSDEVRNPLNEYYKLFWNGHDQDKKMVRELEYMIGFLELLKIKWYQVESTLEYKNINSSILNREYEIRFENDRSFYSYAITNKLLIEDDTNGKVKDSHLSLEGNKKVANIIFNFLTENNIIEKNKLL